MNASASFCYLTTVGRRTGRPHEVEMWFAIEEDRLFMLSGAGERSDWVRNIRVSPLVQVRVEKVERAGSGRVLERDDPDDARARRLLATKYEGWREGQPLSDWAQSSLPVMVTFG